MTTILHPTTSLPNLPLDPSGGSQLAQALRITTKELDILAEVARLVTKDVQGGRLTYAAAVQQPVEAGRDFIPSPAQLDIILGNDELIRALRTKHPLNAGAAAVRQVREILSSMRLYWFDEATVRALLQCTDLKPEPSTAQAMYVLEILKEALLRYRQRLVQEDREFPTAPQGCTVAPNQYELGMALDYNRYGSSFDLFWRNMPGEAEPGRAVLKQLLEVVSGYTN